MARPLAAEEEALAALLARAGVPPRAARCLACLLRGGVVSRAELASAAGLAPQDVSDAMRHLESSGLASVATAPTGGRPALRYRLAASARDSLLHLEAARRSQLEAENAALDELRAIAERK